jgi:hypothetical protein
MKKIIPYVLMVTGSFGAFSLKAQTADEIVNKYFDAIGGKDKIKQITSVYMEGSTQAMGSENPTTITILNGKGFKNETEFGGQKITQVFTDKSGWAITPMGGGGAQELPEEAYKAGRDQINIGGALLDYAANGTTATLLGKDGNNYKVKLVTKDKGETTYYFDATTYYLSKVVKKVNMGGQDAEANIQFTDYKKTDFGYTVPYTMNVDLGQFQMVTTYKKVEVNKPVDPAIFNMPK